MNPPTTHAFPPGEIQSWLDEETLRMLSEWSSADSELERKQLCREWRVTGRLHQPNGFEPS